MKPGSLQLPRRTAVIFWVMTALFVAQMSWWIVFQLSHEREDDLVREQVLQLQRYAAADRWRLYVDRWTDSLRTSWSGLSHGDLNGSRIDRLPGWSTIVFEGSLGRTVLGRREATRSVGAFTASCLDGKLTVTVDTSMVTGFLAREFLNLRYRPETDSLRPLREAVTAASLVIDPHAIKRVLDTGHRRVRMFVMEGGFFLLLILVGALAIHRSLRRSREFELRQRNFIAAVTHELKAPLASIRLFAETLERNDLPDNKRRECLNKIIQDTERLKDLVEDILDAGVLVRRSFHPELVVSDLSADITSYINMYREAAARFGLQLETDITPGLSARTDYRHLRRAFGAIIENAIKYSGPDRRGKHVHVSLTRDGAEAIIRVADQGVGVAESERERVFERFYRAGDEMTRKESGTGLGLYLAREIIEAHHGRIELTSGGHGKGSTVTIALPLTDRNGNPQKGTLTT